MNPGIHFHKLRALRTAVPPLALALLAVGGAFASMAAGVFLWPGDAVPQADVATGSETTAPQQAPLRLRCDTCGIVEAIHRIEPAGGVAASYRFSVRMPDGSLRHSSDALPGRWEIGDHMQLIGGDRTWSQH